VTDQPCATTGAVQQQHNEHQIGIVVPYFQRDPGPLTRALASVAAQTVHTKIHLVIVDDGSPCPAASALSVSELPPQVTVQVVAQTNAGASAARNRALASLPAAVDLVAFLDSDDEWVHDHLARAMVAMDNGIDLYFADHRRADWSESKFTKLALAQLGHRPASYAADLLIWQGELLSAVMRDHAIQTSTVVCRRALTTGCAFPTDLVLGEDEVYWMQLARRARAVGFSLREGVRLGCGVNISQGGAWGDARSVQLLLQNLHYWESVVRKLPDEAVLPALRSERLRALRRELWRTWLHRLRRGQLALSRRIAAGLAGTLGA